MTISALDVKKIFLRMAIFYYMGFLSFITGMFGGKDGDAFATNASGSLANQLFGISLLALALVLIFKLKIVSITKFTNHFFLWGLLIGWFLLSINWSYAPAISFRRIIAFSTMVISAYCLVKIFTPRSLLTAFVIAASLAALLGLIEAVIAPHKAFIEGGIRGGAFTGIYYDKNGGARVYSYALLILVGLGLYKKKWGMVCLMILGLCLLMSRSATAAVMVVGGLSLTMLFNKMRGQRAPENVMRVILLITLLIVGAYVISVLYEFLLGLLDRDPNLTNRTIIWELLTPYIDAEFYSGYGFGAFWASDAVSGFLERWGFIGNAHSGYLEAILHGGVVCLGLVFAIIAHGIYKLLCLYIGGDKLQLASILIPIIIIQVVINYIGFVILNHNSIDMFVFCIAYFIAVTASESVKPVILTNKAQRGQAV